MGWSVDRNVVTRGSQETDLVVPIGGMGSVFANSVFTATVQHIITINMRTDITILPKENSAPLSHSSCPLIPFLLTSKNPPTG